MSFDYTIETMHMCRSLEGPCDAEVGGYRQSGLFSERTWPTCTCPAYKFGRRTIHFGGQYVPKECKHIQEAQKSVCGWHEQFSDERYRQNDDRCPRCGGPVVAVRVAV